MLNDVAISEDVYDFTVEEPLDNLQHVRTCIDVQRLLAFEKIQHAVESAVSQLQHGRLSKKTHIPQLMPPLSAIEDVRQSLKINKKQFLQCWEILIYIHLDPIDKYMEDFVAIVSNRMKEDIIGKGSETSGKQVIEVPSDYDQDMSFVMCKSQSVETASTVQVDENQSKQQEEQLQQLVDERVQSIKLVAEKVSSRCV